MARAWGETAYDDIIAITKGDKYYEGLGRKLRLYYICIIKSNCSFKSFGVPAIFASRNRRSSFG